MLNKQIVLDIAKQSGIDISNEQTLYSFSEKIIEKYNQLEDERIKEADRINNAWDTYAEECNEYERNKP